MTKNDYFPSNILGVNSYLTQPTKAKPRSFKPCSETPQTANPRVCQPQREAEDTLRNWIHICTTELVSELNEELCPDSQAHLESVFVKLKSLIWATWVNLDFLQGSSLSEAAEFCAFCFSDSLQLLLVFYPQQFYFYFYLLQVLNSCWRSETTQNCTWLWCSSVFSWLVGNTTAQF